MRNNLKITGMESKKNNSVFDLKIIEKFKNIDEPSYVIAIDTIDKKALSYCLARECGGKLEIFLCNQRSDENEFTKEVNNLAKYFNATIIKEYS
jgi:hypothetical protein